MIYVVEIEGRPGRQRRSKAVYAYDNFSTAQKAARVLGGRVATYSVGDVRDEDLARVAERRLAELNALRAELEAIENLTLSVRASYGAEEGESMHQWIGRLYSGHRRWRDVLRHVQRMAEEGNEG